MDHRTIEFPQESVFESVENLFLGVELLVGCKLVAFGGVLTLVATVLVIEIQGGRGQKENQPMDGIKLACGKTKAIIFHSGHRKVRGISFGH